MRKNFSTQIAGQIGESLVVAEMGRRGWIATAFSGNVPDIDILGYRDSRVLHIQVKAWRRGSVSFDAARFLDIRWEGSHQIVNGFAREVDPRLIYVFVRLGDHAGDDRYFVLNEIQLAKLVRTGYEAFLARHGGVRPRNAHTTHNAVSVEQLGEFEDRWSLLDDA